MVRKVPYQAKRVQRTKEKRKKKHKHKLGKGERWNGRGGAEQSRSEPTQTDARFAKLTTGENQITTTREMGVAGW